MNFKQQLVALDHHLFYLINHKWSNDVFDAILPFTRESMIWAPLYVFILVLVWYNFGSKGLLWFLIAVCTVALSDMVSSHIIKEAVARLRPCRNPTVADTVIFRVGYCPQSSSFTSSHATNHSALATFFFFTLHRYFNGKALWLFFVWAGIISYAQVYVGVHFPVDVFSGAFIGFFIGYIMSYIFNNKIGLAKHPST